MKKGFSKIFGESWNDYKRNFRSVSLLMLPYVLGLIVMVLISVGFGDVESGGYAFSVLGLAVVLFLVLFGVTGALISSSVKRKKISFKRAFSDMDGRFFGFVWFCIVVSIFLTGLYVLLIIPGIIFSVFWIAAPYIFFAEKVGVIESLRRSFRLVRGRWGKTLGVSILMLLIYFLIIAVFNTVGLVFAIPFAVVGSVLFGSTVKAIFGALGYFVAVPLSIFFFKNVYLALKAKKF